MDYENVVYKTIDKLLSENERYEDAFTIALIITIVEVIITLVIKKWELHIKKEINEKIINFKAKPDYFPEKERALALFNDANLSKSSMSRLVTSKLNNISKTNVAHIAQFAGAAGGDIFNKGLILPYQKSNLIPNATIKQELEFLINLEKTFVVLKTQIIQYSTSFKNDYDGFIELYYKLLKTGAQIVRSFFAIFILSFLQITEYMPSFISVYLIFLLSIIVAERLYKHIVTLSNLSIIPSQY